MKKFRFKKQKGYIYIDDKLVNHFLSITRKNEILPSAILRKVFGFLFAPLSPIIITLVSSAITILTLDKTENEFLNTLIENKSVIISCLFFWFILTIVVTDKNKKIETLSISSYEQEQVIKELEFAQKNASVVIRDNLSVF